MKDLTVSQINDLIRLDKNQAKAFRRLQRAVKDCRELNVYFYQVMETLCGLNGNNVSGIVGSEDFNLGANSPRRTDGLIMPDVDTVCSRADDHHYVVFHGEDKDKIQNTDIERPYE